MMANPVDELLASCKKTLGDMGQLVTGAIGKLNNYLTKSNEFDSLNNQTKTKIVAQQQAEQQKISGEVVPLKPTAQQGLNSQQSQKSSGGDYL